MSDSPQKKQRGHGRFGGELVKSMTNDTSEKWAIVGDGQRWYIGKLTLLDNGAIRLDSAFEYSWQIGPNGQGQIMAARGAFPLGALGSSVDVAVIIREPKVLIELGALPEEARSLIDEAKRFAARVRAESSGIHLTGTMPGRPIA